MIKTFHIVALQQDDRRLLVAGPDLGLRTRAQVVDLGIPHAFPPAYLHAILARGYWEPCPPEFETPELRDLLHELGVVVGNEDQ